MTPTSIPRVLRETGPYPSGRAVRVVGEQRRGPVRDVGQVDAGVGADEAVSGLADHQVAAAAQDADGLLHRPERVLAAVSSWSIATSLPSALDTIFCVTTTTSPSHSSGPSGRAGTTASAMSRATSVPGVTSPMPVTGSTLHVVSPRHRATTRARSAARSGELMTVGATMQRIPSASTSAASDGIGHVHDERARPMARRAGPPRPPTPRSRARP